MDATSIIGIQQTKMFPFFLFFSLIMNDDSSLATYLVPTKTRGILIAPNHVSTASPDDLGYLSQKASSSSSSSFSKEITTKQTPRMYTIRYTFCLLCAWPSKKKKKRVAQR